MRSFLTRRGILGGVASLVMVSSAPEASAASILLDQFRFNGTFMSETSGASMEPQGGTMYDGRYRFDGTAGQGLDSENNYLPNTGDYNHGLFLSGSALTATSAGNYSIVMDMWFDAAGYFKLVDIADTDISGLYRDSGGNLLGWAATDDNLGAPSYPASGQGSSGDMPGDTRAQVTLTRDGSTNIVKAYVNAVEQFAFTDEDGDFIFGLGSLWFFNDDIGNEAWDGNGSFYGPGFVDDIRVYAGAMTEEEIAGLEDLGDPTAVPEPASLLLLGTGLLAGARQWRKKGQPKNA